MTFIRAVQLAARPVVTGGGDPSFTLLDRGARTNSPQPGYLSLYSDDATNDRCWIERSANPLDADGQAFAAILSAVNAAGTVTADLVRDGVDSHTLTGFYSTWPLGGFFQYLFWDTAPLAHLTKGTRYTFTFPGLVV